MEFGPIWRASLKNKTGALLVVLQVAFTMALIVNAVAIAERQAVRMNRPSGVDEPDVFTLRSSAYAANFSMRAAIENDLRTIRGTPGVTSAIQINSVPLSGGGMSSSFRLAPGPGGNGFDAAVYMVDEQGLDALGVKLIAGEGFGASDVLWPEGGGGARWPDKAIVSKALAEAMFPDDPGLGIGQVIYAADTQPVTVVGVVEKLQAPWNGWVNVERTVLVPQHNVSRDVAYLIRAEPGRLDKLMPEIESTLAASEPGRIVQNLQTMERTHERSYDGNHALVNILSFTVAVLVFITTLGVAGLTSFNVTRRIKQIGLRRALGATRLDVLRYFLAENLLFTVVGVMLGAVLAVGINAWLVESFNVPRFSWTWTPVTMAGLVVISQIAVLFPARRAARVPPAVATRTV